ncbi:formyltetrahydrofolate deformylase [Sphingomonas sp. LR60]|uniref:formyltetrahydrofolate deformylase n=1 Tax=Sphingomonas sp. LR60 TaxID=3050233 RepID=UPI002FE068F8
MSRSYTLVIDCPDRPGIVYSVSRIIFENDGNILESRQFEDRETGRFFLRVVFESGREQTVLAAAVATLGEGFDMEWKLVPTNQPVKVLILVSKFDHCLAHLLYKVRIGEIPIEIVGIASNHPATALTATDLRDIPFHHLPVTRDTKAQQEAGIKVLVQDSGAELVVLARYMQILSDNLAAHLSGRCINIHHSFLPSFKGAKPYHQAHAHGVKMIGATAHYVTADLDEGPIIHQGVESVTHEDSPDDLVRKGREIENQVLGQAVAWHVARRVIRNGKKTIVFKG